MIKLFDESERIPFKKYFYISIGIINTSTWIIIFGLSFNQGSGHGLAAFFALLFAIFFNLIVWAVIYYAISKLDDDSKSSYLNVAGAFFVLFLPVFFLLSTLILFELDVEEGLGICWYGYCVFLILIGIKSINYCIKEKSDDMMGAIFAIFFGILIIAILSFLEIPIIG